MRLRREREREENFFLYFFPLNAHSMPFYSFWKTHNSLNDRAKHIRHEVSHGSFVVSPLGDFAAIIMRSCHHLWLFKFLTLSKTVSSHEISSQSDTFPLTLIHLSNSLLSSSLSLFLFLLSLSLLSLPLSVWRAGQCKIRHNKSPNGSWIDTTWRLFIFCKANQKMRLWVHSPTKQGHACNRIPL